MDWTELGQQNGPMSNSGIGLKSVLEEAD